MEFKNKLFGYDKSSVDAEISAYEEQLGRAADEINSLRALIEQSRLEAFQIKNDAQSVSAQSERRIGELEQELAQITENYQKLQQESKENTKRFEGISRIYGYAYDNATEITQSAYRTSKDLLQGTISNFASAKHETRTIMDEFNSNQGQIKHLFFDMVETIRKLDKIMDAVAWRSESMTKSLSVSDDIERDIMDKFDKMIADFDLDAKRVMAEEARLESIGPFKPQFRQTETYSESSHKESVPYHSEAAAGLKTVPAPEEPRQKLSIAKNQEASEPVNIREYDKETDVEARNKLLSVKDLLRKYSQLD